MNTLYALLAKVSLKGMVAHLCWLLVCVNLLSGTVSAQTAINFTSSALSGEALVNPTSLQFGPDNRLYVSQQNGTILAYTIKKNGANSYSVLATETILGIKNIPNHDDNGVVNTAVTSRQVTGILVAGTSANPVLYVSSSDPRIGGGGTAGDKNLDTNSGIISKLTWNGSSWVKVDIVKGLPRSEENHSNNGMALDAATNTLYVAQGGHTNAGSPSNNFAFITEYALSAAILKINLNQIQTSFGGSYTLPTLDDPTRANSGPNGSDVNDPWGGNDGVNQAKLVAGGPVQIHSAGYRNAYDLVITKTAGKTGRMYTIDNGANAGWGGYPDKEGTASVTNKYVVGEPGSTTAGVNDAKVNNLDNLHLVSSPVLTPIYGGHPNPIRANPAGAGIYTFNNTTGVGTFSLNPTSDWPPVPVSMAKPVESDYRNPGVNDGALYTWGSSTNGIAEYTSQAFNGALSGDLLAASFDGNIYRIKLNTSGTAISNVSILAGGFGSQPLDVTAQGDNAIFPGTIWAATYGANSITIFEPAGTNNCTGDVSSFNLDDDDDGYSNGDETANGTDPCSAASKPEDFDGDFVSNLRDSDDDNDGLNDMTDKFAWDNLNGTSTNMPIDYPFLNGNPGFGFFGMGFTGLMTNNTTDYQNNFDLSKPNLVMGGAVGIASTPAEPGDPTTNNQKYAFQFGVNIKQTTPPFTIQGKLLGSSFFDGSSGSQLGTQSQGIYFGTGDQNNYMRLVLHANNGNPGFQILIENNGSVTYSNIFPVSNILSASAIDVFFDINPANGAVQCKYQTNSASTPVTLGPAFTMTGNMLTALQNNNAVAIGLIASAGNKSAFTASWDYVKVISSVPQALTEVIRINSGGPAVQFGTESWKADQYFSGGGSYSSTSAISNTTNDALYQTERYGNMTYNIPVPQTGQYAVDLHFAELYFSTSGSRVFNLNVESSQFALQNIDLYKDYGGKNAASVIKASNVQVNDGFLTITLTNVVNNAKISGIAVFLQSATPANRPPVVNKPSDISLTSGQSWSYQVIASDPDQGAVLTYSATGLPASLNINANTGLISGSISASVGTYTVNLTVKDQQNLSVSTSFVITVTSSGGLTEVVRINSGGPAVQFGTESWKADQYFSGGGTYSGTSAISNTTNDALYQTERYGNMTYNIPVPQTGQYTVDLHFAELYFSTSGSRVFNLNVESGQFTLQNIDLYKDYGGKNAASVIKASNVQVNDGFLTITLTNVVNNAKISGIAVFLQSATPANRPPVVNKPSDISLTSGQSWSYQVIASDPDQGAVLTYSATGLPASLNINANTGLISGSISASVGTYTVNLTVKDQQNLSVSTSFVITVTSSGGLTEVVRINSGGPAVQFGSELWKADQYFSGGGTFSSTMAISNTTNDALYQSERKGNMTYNIPVPQTGQYTVDLHFAELYFSTSGSRVFNLNVESGQFSLQNIDLYKDYGGKGAAAVIKASNVQVNDGFLTITLTNVVNNAKISGIAVFLQSGAATNQAPVANAGPDKTITLPVSSVVLSGSGSDPEDGTNVTYSWSQVSGPSTAAFSSATQASPTVSNLVAGTYVFALTVKDSKLLSSPSDQVSVIVNPAASIQQLVSFTLINAANEQEIQTLSSNATLNLASLPSQSLNIRANTNPATVGSVVFALSGTQTRNYTETGAPYSLFGDVNGNYNGWTPAVGSYTLKGTPYSAASGGGTAGTPLTISFTVINQVNRPPVVTKPANISLNVGQSWSYQVQASDPDPGSILTYSATGLPASLSIDANTGLISGSVTAVQGTYTVNLTVKDQQNLSASTSFVITVVGSTNQAPVANAGPDKTITLPTSSVQLSGSGSDPEDGTNITYTWSQVSGPSTAAFSSTTQSSPTVNNLIAGTYVFGLIVRDSKLLSSPSDPVSVIVNPATGGSQQLVSFALINASNEQEIQTLATNTTLNLATLPSQSLNIKANTSPATVGSVVFALSGTQSRNQTETGAPYALFGDNNGNYNAWTPAVGNYTLKATPYSSSGGGGIAGTPLTINFTVVNQANQMPIITQPVNANVITGQIFNYQISANDPEGTALSYSASNLPESLNINSSTGLISGTVTGPANIYSVIITVKDLQGLAASTTFTITVSNPNQPPVVTRPQNMSVTAGQNFSYQVIANDPEGTALEYKATNLPVGLTISTVNGLISGTVNDQAADYTVTLEVQDQQGLMASTSFVIAVMNANQAPVINQPVAQTATRNLSFTYQVDANDPEDGKTGLVYAANGLPAGLGVNSETGLISGLVTAVIGDYTVLLNVQDKDGLSGVAKSFTITVSNANEAPIITQPTDQVATINSYFSYQVMASDPEDGLIGLVYSASELPPGLTIDSTNGLISGTVTGSPGNYSVILGVKDKNGLSGSGKSFTIRVSNANQAPVITNPGDKIATRNASFSYLVEASDPEDGQNGLQYFASGLPGGLNIHLTTGVISGTVTAEAGDYDVALGAEDQYGLAADEVVFTITVNNVNEAPVITNPGTLTANQAFFSYQVLASDPEDGTTGLVYSASGLPEGITIHTTSGLISGTVTALAGNYDVTLGVADSDGLSASISFRIAVVSANQAPVIIDPGVIIVIANDPGNYQILVNDPDPDDILLFSVQGLPEGLTINSTGLISGTVVNSTGDYEANVTVTDSHGASDEASFIVRVNNRPALVTPESVTLLVGELWEYQLETSDADANAVFTYSATGLPAGLSIDNTGKISGMLTDEVGVYTVSLIVTDESGLTANTSFMIELESAQTEVMSTRSLPLMETLETKNRNLNKEVMSVFPNPAQKHFSVEFSVNARSNWKFTLYNTAGQFTQLPVAHLEKGVRTVTFDLSSYNLVPGVYYLIITNDLNERKSSKIIIN